MCVELLGALMWLWMQKQHRPGRPIRAMDTLASGARAAQHIRTDHRAGCLTWLPRGCTRPAQVLARIKAGREALWKVDTPEQLKKGWAACAAGAALRRSFLRHLLPATALLPLAGCR